MLTKLKGSLTLRIFLITSALVVAACGVTYGAIAYLTPLSYTSLLEEELNRESAALLARLSQSTADECETLLMEFARKTGADMRLTDAYGYTLYDTLSVAADLAAAYGGTSESAEERGGGAQGVVAAGAGEAAANSAAAPATSTLSGVIVIENTEASDVGSAAANSAAAAAPALSGVTVIESGADSASSYSFAFRDGTGASLAVRGGQRAVNQAAEAMK